MNSKLIPFAIAIVIIAFVAAGVIYFGRDVPVAVTGEFRKVRVQKIDNERTFVAVDLRLTNVSRSIFQVEEVKASVDVEGRVTEAEVGGESDLKSIFDYFPALGPIYTPSLKIRDRLTPGQILDRTVGFSVKLSDQDIAARTRIVLRVKDADGDISEIVEKRN